MVDVGASLFAVYHCGMSTLREIEAAADSLPPAQQQELLLFLVARLRAHGGQLPLPRKFTQGQIGSWISEDEGDMKRLGDGNGQ